MTVNESAVRNNFSFRYMSGAFFFLIVSVGAFYLDARGIFLHGFPLLTAIAVVGYVLLLAAYLLTLTIYLYRKRTAKALSVLFGVVTLAALLPIGTLRARRAVSTIDVFRFKISQPYYLDLVKSSPSDGAPKLIAFAWGWWGFLTTNEFLLSYSMRVTELRFLKAKERLHGTHGRPKNFTSFLTDHAVRT